MDTDEIRINKSPNTCCDCCKKYSYLYRFHNTQKFYTDGKLYDTLGKAFSVCIVNMALNSPD